MRMPAPDDIQQLKTYCFFKQNKISCMTWFTDNLNKETLLTMHFELFLLIYIQNLRFCS